MTIEIFLVVVGAATCLLGYIGLKIADKNTYFKYVDQKARGGEWDFLETAIR